MPKSQALLVPMATRAAGSTETAGAGGPGSRGDAVADVSPRTADVRRQFQEKGAKVWTWTGAKVAETRSDCLFYDGL